MLALREETGYVAKLEDCVVTGALPLSPGLSNETVALVTVQIDLTLDENHNPLQHLEESEDIQVMRVPMEGLKATLDGMQKDGECHVFLGLHCIAMGLEWGKTMSGWSQEQKKGSKL